MPIFETPRDSRLLKYNLQKINKYNKRTTKKHTMFSFFKSKHYRKALIIIKYSITVPKKILYANYNYCLKKRNKTKK